jgi:hypothetical protein
MLTLNAALMQETAIFLYLYAAGPAFPLANLYQAQQINQSRRIAVKWQSTYRMNFCASSRNGWIVRREDGINICPISTFSECFESIGTYRNGAKYKDVYKSIDVYSGPPRMLRCPLTLPTAILMANFSRAPTRIKK